MKKLKQTILFSSLSLALSLSSHAFAAHINSAQSDINSDAHVYHLPNGLNVTRADIIALLPYFEADAKPMAQAHSDKERAARFTALFNSIAIDANGAQKAQQLLTLLHTQSDKAKSALPATESADRFGNNAVEAYRTAHAIAINDAIVAHQTVDRKRFEMAVAKNIIACQYLTYRFAAGHIRTPRPELSAHTTPALIGDYLSAYMHDEENQYGIVVHNPQGDHWVAYGESTLQQHKNSMQESVLDRAKSISYAEILKVFITGQMPTNDYIALLIPMADEVDNAGDKDISPLFYWDNREQKILRRVDMTNPYSRSWTADWWGWSTLAELERERGLSAEARHELVTAGYKYTAIQYGIRI